MNKLIEWSELSDIFDKVEAGKRIDENDCLRLFRSHDLATIGVMANLMRERKHGNAAYYILNRHINYSNICILSCQFCAFAARKRDAHAFEYAIDEIVRAVADALPDRKSVV